jgi:quercetin dioxygenase-like cupin family protein
MLALQLAERNLVDISSETDETRRIRVDFPISSIAGAASTAVVYFEFEPGEHTGMHTDSADEIVLILSGSAEAIVGDERGELSAGGLGLVPALVPHDVRNIGDETVRVVGFFSSGIVVSVFDDPLMPAGNRVAARLSRTSRRWCRLEPRPERRLASLGKAPCVRAFPIGRAFPSYLEGDTITLSSRREPEHRRRPQGGRSRWRSARGRSRRPQRPG